MLRNVCFQTIFYSFYVFFLSIFWDFSAHFIISSFRMVFLSPDFSLVQELFYCLYLRTQDLFFKSKKIYSSLFFQIRLFLLFLHSIMPKVQLFSIRLMFLSFSMLFPFFLISILPFFFFFFWMSLNGCLVTYLYSSWFLGGIFPCSDFSVMLSIIPLDNAHFLIFI